MSLTVLELAGWISLVMLAIAALGAVYRIARGPATLDRAIASDVLLISISTGLCVWMAMKGTSSYIMFVVVASVIGFIGSVTLARFAVDGTQVHHPDDDAPNPFANVAASNLMIQPIDQKGMGQRSMYPIGAEAKEIKRKKEARRRRRERGQA